MEVLDDWMTLEQARASNDVIGETLRQVGGNGGGSTPPKAQGKKKPPVPEGIPKKKTPPLPGKKAKPPLPAKRVGTPPRVE